LAWDVNGSPLKFFPKSPENWKCPRISVPNAEARMGLTETGRKYILKKRKRIKGKGKGQI